MVKFSMKKIHLKEFAITTPVRPLKPLIVGSVKSILFIRTKTAVPWTAHCALLDFNSDARERLLMLQQSNNVLFN